MIAFHPTGEGIDFRNALIIRGNSCHPWVHPSFCSLYSSTACSAAAMRSMVSCMRAT